MTYSIFTSTGNLVDWVDNRDAALALLTNIVQWHRGLETEAAGPWVRAIGRDGSRVEAIVAASSHLPTRLPLTGRSPLDRLLARESSLLGGPSSSLRVFMRRNGR